MPEWGPLGSVRGALSNERPYRDLRNVVANYPFESSRGFPGSEPDSGHGDHSRLSCSEQKKILKRCRGLFYLCAGGAEARRFNRLLIDAGLIQGF